MTTFFHRGETLLAVTRELPNNRVLIRYVAPVETDAISEPYSVDILLATGWTISHSAHTPTNGGLSACH